MDNTTEEDTFLRMYCLFCYKSYTISNFEYDTNLACDFFKALQKNKSIGKIHLKSPVLKGEPCHTELEKFVARAVHSVCNDCAIVVEQYNVLYRELEHLQMRLRWKVMQLHRIMKASARVPSRVMEYEDNIERHFKSELEGDDDDGMMGEVEHVHKTIKGFREQIFKTCGSILKVKIPQVRLRRLNDPIPIEGENNAKVHYDDDWSKTSEEALLPIDNASHGECLNLNPSSTDNIWDNTQLISISEISYQELKAEGGNGENIHEVEEQEEEEVKATSAVLSTSTLENEGADLPNASTEEDQPPENVARDDLLDHSDVDVKLGSSQVGPENDNNENSALQSEEDDEMTTVPSDEDETPSCSDAAADSDHSEAETKQCRKRKRRKNRSPAKKMKYKCSIKGCNARGTTKAKIEAHLLTHGNFPCSVCDFTGDKVSELVDHEMKTHATLSEDKSLIQCTRCSAKFKSFKRKDDVITKVMEYIVEHFLTKHFNIPVALDEDENKCKICGREYPQSRLNSSKMRLHMKECHDIEGKDEDEIFRCQKCSAPFLTDYQRLMHIWKDHGLRWHCVHCDLSFPNRNRYRGHMDKHSQAGQYKCEIPGCGQTFHTKNSLNFHNVAHKGNSKLLTCPKSGCKRSFMNEYQLRTHLKAFHNHRVKRKEWTCEKCGKSFFVGPNTCLKARIEAHMQSHFHDGPSSWKFSCDVCGKMCKNNFKLEEHMRTHSKEKPFACEYCGRSFSILFNLKRHIKLVHKVQTIREQKKNKWSSITDSSSNDDDDDDVTNI